MERLTKWNGEKYVLPPCRTDGESYYRIIAERLAAYENTGYEPWELPIKPRPRGYDIEVVSGDCYHKEIFFGTAHELTEKTAEIGATARNEWGWRDAIVTATEWRKEN